SSRRTLTQNTPSATAAFRVTKSTVAGGLRRPSQSRTALAPMNSATVQTSRNGADRASVFSFRRGPPRGDGRSTGEAISGHRAALSRRSPPAKVPGNSRQLLLGCNLGRPAGRGVRARRGVILLPVLVSLVLSASASDGTVLDIRTFQVVQQSSG